MLGVLAGIVVVGVLIYAIRSFSAQEKIEKKEEVDQNA